VNEYTLAVNLQNEIIKRASEVPFRMLPHERVDHAMDITYEWIRTKEVEPPQLAYMGLQVWFQIYGGNSV
jgi:hypothetical protein